MQLILLDLKLPKLNGIEVLKEIRSSEVTHNVPVVMLTTSDSDEDMINSYEIGVNSYIRKPVDFDEFVKAVGQVGVYWLMLNQVPYD